MEKIEDPNSGDKKIDIDKSAPQQVSTEPAPQQVTPPVPPEAAPTEQAPQQTTPPVPTEPAPQQATQPVPPEVAPPAPQQTTQPPPTDPIHPSENNLQVNSNSSDNNKNPNHDKEVVDNTPSNLKINLQFQGISMMANVHNPDTHTSHPLHPLSYCGIDKSFDPVYPRYTLSSEGKIDILHKNNYCALPEKWTIEIGHKEIVKSE